MFSSKLRRTVFQIIQDLGSQLCVPTRRCHAGLGNKRCSRLSESCFSEIKILRNVSCEFRDPNPLFWSMVWPVGALLQIKRGSQGSSPEGARIRHPACAWPAARLLPSDGNLFMKLSILIIPLLLLGHHWFRTCADVIYI